MTLDKYYVLDADGNPQLAKSLEEWARWFENSVDARRTARTALNDGVEVSTVFLGTDHQWGSGPPLLFETMIFGGQLNQHQWRWTTRVQALAAHDQIVAALRAGQTPPEA